MNNFDLLKAKLIYRSLHRGCKENDVIFKAFVKSDLFQNLSLEEVSIYSNLLEEPDVNIYEWISNQHSIVPERYTTLIQKIQIALTTWRENLTI